VLLHEDACYSLHWPDLSTSSSLKAIADGKEHVGALAPNDPDLIELLADCERTSEGVLSEGVMSAVANGMFNTRETLSAVFLDLTGQPPPSMQRDQADNSIISGVAGQGMPTGSSLRGRAANDALQGMLDMAPRHLQTSGSEPAA